jgi:hypothetical protein
MSSFHPGTSRLHKDFLSFLSCRINFSYSYSSTPNKDVKLFLYLFSWMHDHRGVCSHRLTQHTQIGSVQFFTDSG